MTFTNTEKAQIAELSEKYEVIKKLWEDYLVPSPSRHFNNQCAKMIEHLSDEMEWLREGKINKIKILNSEEKLFERINIIMVNGDKYFNTLDKGMQLIDPPKEVSKSALRGKKQSEDVRLSV